MSITVPKEIFDEISKTAAMKNKKISHLVTEALEEKLKKLKEEAFVSEINRIFEDPEIVEEQRKMAEDIAVNTDIEELPW